MRICYDMGLIAGESRLNPKSTWYDPAYNFEEFADLLLNKEHPNYEVMRVSFFAGVETKRKEYAEE